MSHLDEGTLHALLDGELDAKEVREIQAHLGSCSACGTRLQSVKEVAAESDRLVGVLEFPGTPRRPAALDAMPVPVRHTAPEADSAPGPAFSPDQEVETGPGYDSVADEAEAAPLRPQRPMERRIGAEPVYHEAPPVILVPDDYAWAERRRRVVTFGRWAALLVVAVGAGFIASEVRKSGAPLPGATSDRLGEDTAPVVSSAEETSRPDSALAFARESVAQASKDQPAAPTPTATRPERTRPVPAAEPAKAAAKRPAPEPDRADKVANVAAPAAAGFADEAQERDEAGEMPPADQNEPVPAPNVREEAAQAMEDLDRERRLERAAAATAALDSERRRTARNAAAREATPPAAPAPAPVPRTLEQRSNIYLRIGLDEAARQLGRPVHVIEGMQQQFMGLAQGVSSPAADATRPVVRVVYQDNQGRMILLDQQRIRPGQTWGSSETRWVVGEIGLALMGEPASEILRNLRPRVR
jgi:putative zinc finger protein